MNNYTVIYRADNARYVGDVTAYSAYEAASYVSTYGHPDSTRCICNDVRGQFSSRFIVEAVIDDSLMQFFNLAAITNLDEFDRERSGDTSVLVEVGGVGYVVTVTPRTLAEPYVPDHQVDDLYTYDADDFYGLEAHLNAIHQFRLNDLMGMSWEEQTALHNRAHESMRHIRH